MNSPLPFGILFPPRKNPVHGFFAAAACLAVATGAHAATSGSPHIIEAGHVDFSFCNQGGTWSVGLIWDSSVNPVAGSPAAGSLLKSDQAIMTAKDRPFEEGGNRVIRPAGDGVWGFTGVAEQEPFWWFPQTNWSGVWPGFNVCTDCGVSYFENDPRIRAEGAWKVVQLLDVRYRGRGSGHYSTWSTDTFGGIVPWMSTADGGITDEDTYFVGPAGHSHPAMGFSSPGVYEVTFNITCYGGPGKTNPDTSPASTYYFAVGTYWEWLARHFRPGQWREAGISGEMADPDRDGIANLMEYACGLDPTKPDSRTYGDDERTGLPELTLQESTGQLFLRYPRRSAESRPQIQYTLRTTGDPASKEWTEVSVPAVSPRGDDPGWEDVSLLIPQPAGSGRRFYRLEATLLNDPADS